MPVFNAPAQPTPKFGVWDSYGREANPAVHRKTTPGWIIEPRYWSNFAIFTNRQDLTERLEREQQEYERRKERLMLDMLTLKAIFEGREIASATCDYTTLTFNMARGGAVTFRYMKDQYWRRTSTPTVTLPETGPYIVKLMYANGKMMRLENGEVIVMNHYGKLRVTGIPDWLREELFG